MHPAIETFIYWAKKYPDITHSIPMLQEINISDRTLDTKRNAVAGGRIKNPMTIIAPTAWKEVTAANDNISIRE